MQQTRPQDAVPSFFKTSKMQASTPGDPAPPSPAHPQVCGHGEVRSVNGAQAMAPPPSAARSIRIKQYQGPCDKPVDIEVQGDSDFNQHPQLQPERPCSFPFECYCGHKFYNQNTYRAHIIEKSCVQWKDVKIHDSIILCTCGVQFAQRGSLFRHLRTRQCRAYWPNGGRALVCLCGAKFNRRDNMIRHQKSPRCRQNCSRKGIQGDPCDRLPPPMHNPYRQPLGAARYSHSMGDSATETSEDEASVARRHCSEPTLVAESFCLVRGTPRRSEFPHPCSEPALDPGHSDPPTPIDSDHPCTSPPAFTPASMHSLTPSCAPVPAPAPAPAPASVPAQSFITFTPALAPMLEPIERPPPAGSMCFQKEPISPWSHTTHADPTRSALNPALQQDTLEDRAPAPAPAPAPPFFNLTTKNKDLAKALEELFVEVTDIMDRYGVAAPIEIARLVIEAIDSTVVGFVGGAGVLPARAALMCQAISAGVSQILLVKLHGISDENFVLVVHYTDSVIYRRLAAPLKALIEVASTTNANS